MANKRGFMAQQKRPMMSPNPNWGSPLDFKPQPFRPSPTGKPRMPSPFSRPSDDWEGLPFQPSGPAPGWQGIPYQPDSPYVPPNYLLPGGDPFDYNDDQRRGNPYYQGNWQDMWKNFRNKGV